MEQRIKILGFKNNKFEAKFKAYRNGFRQAAQIIGDNVGIKDFEAYLILSHRCAPISSPLKFTNFHCEGGY